MTTPSRIAAALIALLTCVGPALALPPYLNRPEPLALAFDHDGEGADASQSLAATQIADSTSYTVAANPDVCRFVNVAIVDLNASITVGTLTITGTDCWDYPLSLTYNMAGGSGSRTGTLVDITGSPKKASGAYFKTITTISNGVVTGEGGAADTVAVGVSAQAKAWPMYGRQTTTASGQRWVDVLGQYDVNCLVKNGAAITDVVGVSASTTACFQNVVAGDMLILNIAGELFWRKVATRADADTITINQGVTIPTAGVNFSYRKFYYFADPQDGWISTSGWAAISFTTNVVANADTGGIITSTECAIFGIDQVTPELLVEEDTTTVATGAAGTRRVTINLDTAVPYTHCRSGLSFGTTDDADAAVEDIDITVGFRQ